MRGKFFPIGVPQRPSNHLHEPRPPLNTAPSSCLARAPEPLSPRHWHLFGKLTGPLNPGTAQAPLTPLLAPLEPTRSFVALTELLARRSTGSSGRRRAVANELVAPREPRASRPSQHLH
jgi:hypothetical protein